MALKQRHKVAFVVGLFLWLIAGEGWAEWANVRQAKQLVTQEIEGRKVFLENDDAQAPFDKYGRRLAYVYLEDRTLLNRELVRQGYAEAIYFFPYKFKEEFLTLEKQAKKERLGMWKK